MSYGGTDGINLSVDKYDTEAAKALVEAAGYTPEKPLELKLVTYSYNTGFTANDRYAAAGAGSNWN